MAVIQHTINVHKGDVNGVAFSKDYLASVSSDKTVRLWDCDGYTEHSSSPLMGHKYAVYCCAFSKDEETLATCSQDGKLTLWTVKSGERIRDLAHESTNSIRVCRFSSDGHRLVTGSDDQCLVLWNLKEPAIPERQLSVDGDGSSVVAVAFSPNDGLYVVSGNTNGNLRIWDAMFGHSKQLVCLLDGHDLGVTCCEFSPTYGSAGDIDPKKATQVHFLLATCGNDDLVKLWDVLAFCGSTNVALRLRDTLAGHSGPVMACCFSPNGNMLASVGSDKAIRLWDPLKGISTHTMDAHLRYITCCAFSTDGQFLATGSNDRTVKVWKVGGDNSNVVPTAPDLVDTSIPEPKPRAPVLHWTIDDVSKWLEEIGLPQYIGHFRCNAIDGRELLTLSQNSLQLHIGIAPLGHRNKIVRALENVDKHPMIQQYDNDDHIPDEYLCPITREVMRDPVIASDGYTYEAAAIKSWLDAGKRNSPMTNAPLKDHNLTPNRSLKMLIQKRRQSMP